MQTNKRVCWISSIHDKFGGNMHPMRESDAMGKEDRKRRVLEILAKSQLALPPAVIFRNAKLRGADFERRSVNNYLPELYEEGLVEKVNPKALEDGEIEPIDITEDGYFIITDEGMEQFNNE